MTLTDTEPLGQDPTYSVNVEKEDNQDTGVTHGREALPGVQESFLLEGAHFSVLKSEGRKKQKQKSEGRKVIQM